jgi:AbrB family looped-hinge helix DNA binding protein
MNGLTTITTKGQVTIPESIRRLLGAQIGDRIYFDKVYPEKKQILVKLVPKNAVDRLFGSLSSKGKYTSLQSVRNKSVKALAKKYNLK